MITSEQIKELRERTGISVMQCKKALQDAGGDMDKACAILKEKGAEIASKKAHRATGSGVIDSYIHSDNKMGVLLELLCETDFVAKNDEFKELASDIALQIAAMNPKYISSSEVPEEKREDKEYLKEHVLLLQPFVKDPSQNIGDLIGSAVLKIGENITISRFKRYALLEG
ncbi:MAG: elongation factor Ts [Candidatus Paceibacterota bacterium]